MKTVKTVLFFAFILIGTLSIFADNPYAISLDGGESFYVNDGNNALDVSAHWTFEAWIKVGSYVSGDWDCIMDRRTVFSFYLIDDITEPVGDYAVKFAARDGSTIVASMQSDSLATMNFGTWYHVAANYDSTEAKLFVNDTEVDTSSDSLWSLTSSTNAINLGGRWWGSYSRQMTDTDIDEIRVSNVARAIGEMQTNVDDDPYTVDTNTVLLMHLNDEGNPPTYESGTDPVLDGFTGDDDISTADYVDPGTLTFGDQSAPVFASTYPKVQNETGTSMELAVQIDEDGTAYYVVLADSAAAPTVAEVKAGTGSGGTPAIENGDISLLADTENTDLIEGLTQNTQYDIYVVAEDDEVPPNVQDAVTKIDAGTIIEDEDPPVFVENYPMIIDTTATTLELAAKIDENGIAYFVVLENDAAAPTVQEVKAGTGSGGSEAIDSGDIPLTADSENSVVIDSLGESTDFDIYVVAEDDAVPPNLQDTVSRIDANTLLNYRTQRTGFWSNHSSWERYNGTSWINADNPPTFLDNTISILSSHTLTLSDTTKIDQMTIEANAQLTVAENGYFTVNNGSGIDLSVFGILRKEGNGIITRLDDPVIEFTSGSKFELAGTNRYIIVADWNENSTCEINGEIGGDMSATYHTDQAFGNFVWNCPTQTDNVYFSGALDDINGDFQLIDTNGYEFRLTGTAGDDPAVYIEGNATISGGILNLTSGDNNIFFICDSNFVQTGGEIKATGTGSGNLRFGPMTGSGYEGTFTHSGGTFTPDDIRIRESYALTLNSNMNIGTAPFTINGDLICGNYDIEGTGLVTLGNSGQIALTSDLDLDEAGFVVDGILECGIYTISGDSTFTINSSGIIRTGHTQGLNGTILLNGTKTFNPNADYEFNGTSPQVTGSYLPPEISDGLWIINPTGVSLSDSTMISGGNTGLVLRDGKLITSSENTLTFATDGGWTEASDSSFISGPVIKIRSSTTGFLFPLGKDDIYAPLQIFPESADETIFQAEYFDESYSDTSTCEDSLGEISTVEYWTLDRLEGIADAKVRLYWGDHSFGTIPDSLVVARWDSTLWVDAGQYEIDLTDQWITSETVEEFSPFTFGAIQTGTPQPPDTPANVQITIARTEVTISWDEVTAATSYSVYSSDDPYAETFDLEQAGITELNWTGTISDDLKFYRVTSSN